MERRLLGDEYTFFTLTVWSYILLFFIEAKGNPYAQRCHEESVATRSRCLRILQNARGKPKEEKLQ